MSPPTFQLSGGSKCVIKKLSATQNQIWQEDFLSNSLIYTEYKNAIGYVFNGFLLWLRKFRFSKVIWWWNNRCVCQGLSKLAKSWPFSLYFWNFVFAKMFLYLCISSCDIVFFVSSVFYWVFLKFSIFPKCFLGSTGVLVRRAVTARNWSTFLWSRPTPTTPFILSDHKIVWRVSLYLLISAVHGLMAE